MTLDEQAMALYQAYPRKVARGAALKAIKKSLIMPPEKGGIGYDAMLGAVLEYAEAKKGQESRFVPIPVSESPGYLAKSLDLAVVPRSFGNLVDHLLGEILKLSLLLDHDVALPVGDRRLLYRDAMFFQHLERVERGRFIFLLELPLSHALGIAH